MPDTPPSQASIFGRYLCESIERLLGCLDGLAPDQLDWQPPAPEANSLYVLAVHTMANAEEVVVFVLGGQPNQRNREAEFLAQATSGAALDERWHFLHAQITGTLAGLPNSALNAPVDHPRRGRISGREVLILACRHAAEHAGQAELTRDLLRAATAG